MPRRDASGYIVEEGLSLAHNSPFQAFSSPSTSLTPPHLLVTRLGQVQATIAHFIDRFANFTEQYVLSPSTLRFISKYLFYPFISGAFSATIAYVRRRK